MNQPASESRSLANTLLALARIVAGIRAPGLSRLGRRAVLACEVGLSGRVGRMAGLGDAERAAEALSRGVASPAADDCAVVAGWGAHMDVCAVELVRRIGTRFASIVFTQAVPATLTSITPPRAAVALGVALCVSTDATRSAAYCCAEPRNAQLRSGSLMIVEKSSITPWVWAAIALTSQPRSARSLAGHREVPSARVPAGQSVAFRGGSASTRTG